MPRCSVVVCKNSSCKVNYMKNGISFHTYPKDAEIKEKWINATGRGPSWFPTKNSTICSSHFEPKCLQPLKKVRRLFEWSIPTLNLRIVLTNYVEPSTSKVRVDCELDTNYKNKLNLTPNSPMVTELRNLTSEQNDDSQTAVPKSPMDTTSNLIVRQSILEHPKTLDKNEIIETPRKRKLRQLINAQEHLIKKQKLQIKKLQKSTSRYRRKIASLKDILENLI